MKKLLVFGIFALSMPCSFGYIISETSSSVPSIKAQGYSESMARVVDHANVNHSGMHGSYVRYYTPKPGKHALGRAYTRAKVYFDPIQEDGDFGQHEINYSNNWMGDETSYTTPVDASRPVDNL